MIVNTVAALFFKILLILIDIKVTQFVNCSLYLQLIFYIVLRE
jgi:hypothetical protein